MAEDAKCRRWGLALLILSFAVSVAVRLPLLEAPIGQTRHQWLTAHVLHTLRIWSEEGAIQPHRFLPIMTCADGANRHIFNVARQEDASGRTYYTSYPLLGFVLPYLVIRPFDPGISALSLRLFSLAIHGISGLLVYLLVIESSRHAPRAVRRLAPALVPGGRPAQVPGLNAVCQIADGTRSVPATVGGLVGASIYFFTSLCLWYHCQVYFCDMLVQPLFLAAVLLTMRTADDDAGRSLGRTWALIGVVFAMALTEWLGVLFAGVLWIYALAVLRGRIRWVLAIGVPGAVLAAIVLTLAHFSLIAGPGAYLGSLMSKFLQRAGVVASEIPSEPNVGPWSPAGWAHVLDRYVHTFLLMGTFLAAVGLVWLVSARRGIGEVLRREKGNWGRLAWLIGMPILLHHLLLFQFTVIHLFALLKSCCLVSVFGGLWFSGFWEGLAQARTAGYRRLAAGAIGLVFLLACGASVRQYYVAAGAPDDCFEQFADTVRHSAENEDVVFVDGKVVPQMVLYTRRNIARWEDDEAAAALLRANRAAAGVIFTVEEDTQRVIGVRRFAPSAEVAARTAGGKERK